MDSADLPGIDDAPADLANCRVETTIRVGPAGDPSGDDFTLFFVTPESLARKSSPGDFSVLEYTVVVSRFEWPVAERVARALVASRPPPPRATFAASHVPATAPPSTRAR